MAKHLKKDPQSLLFCLEQGGGKLTGKEMMGDLEGARIVGLADNCQILAVRSDICKIGQLSVRTTVRSDNCQIGQLSVRTTVRSDNCQIGQLSDRTTVRSDNCQWDNCQWAMDNCQKKLSVL